jgi:plasmid stabilization system protein ParE
MKKYKVILHPDAESDIESSFKWGCRAWGEKNAKLWVRQLRRAISKQLTTLPVACPLAPESEQLGVSIRHLIVGRYRALFTVRGRTVTILQVSGPYTDPDETV